MKILSGNNILSIEQSEDIYLKISSYTSNGFNIKDALIKIKNSFEKSERSDSDKVTSILGKWE